MNTLGMSSHDLRILKHCIRGNEQRQITKHTGGESGVMHQGKHKGWNKGNEQRPVEVLGDSKASATRLIGDEYGLFLYRYKNRPLHVHIIFIKTQVDLWEGSVLMDIRNECLSIQYRILIADHLYNGMVEIIRHMRCVDSLK